MISAKTLFITFMCVGVAAHAHEEPFECMFPESLSSTTTSSPPPRTVARKLNQERMYRLTTSSEVVGAASA